MTEGRGDIELFDERSPGAEALLREFHDAILFPSFPPNEYVPPTTIDLAEGPALIACTDDGRVVGGALGERYPASGALLLCYLAVRPGLRGAGVGRLLLTAVVDRWLDDRGPMFLELDDPRHHAPHPGYGDPTARLRFYDRFGVRALAIPYFQPRLLPHQPRGYHMLLGVLPSVGADLPGTMPGPPIAAFLREYFVLCEGPNALDDAEVQSLLAASDGPAIPLIPLTELERIPDP